MSTNLNSDIKFLPPKMLERKRYFIKIHHITAIQTNLTSKSLRKERIDYSSDKVVVGGGKEKAYSRVESSLMREKHITSPHMFKSSVSANFSSFWRAKQWQPSSKAYKAIWI